eukprot:SAG31_NODE_1378_length_8588_cov_2.424382_4_plen_457_part_00
MTALPSEAEPLAAATTAARSTGQSAELENGEAAADLADGFLQKLDASATKSRRGGACTMLLGLVLLLFGVGAWVGNEIEWELTWSFVGKCCTAVGAILMVAALTFGRNDDNFSSQRRFSFRLINAKFREDGEQLDDLLGSLPITVKVPKSVQEQRARLAKQEELEAGNKSKARQDRFEEHMQRLAREGATVRELDAAERPCCFVLDFKGDLQATAVQRLRQQVTMLIEYATCSDEVVVRLESPGGLVSEYGLAASQLLRLRKAKSAPKLTVCVDTMAASGGYLMAAMADHIAAAPFAIVGSIGVIAVIPNVSRLLEEKNVDVLQFTAGKYKRTVTPYTEVTESHREKLQGELELMHAAFKTTLVEHRPALADKIDHVATGEAWMACTSVDKSLCLVDELCTSDELLAMRARAGYAIIKVKDRKKPSTLAMLAKFFTGVGEHMCGWIGRTSIMARFL